MVILLNYQGALLLNFLVGTVGAVSDDVERGRMARPHAEFGGGDWHAMIAGAFP